MKTKLTTMINSTSAS
ncbi:Protein of unknown function [Lactobacillus delbrueckii subsp. lactis]|nr:Protein of unknown function [Lactobacillus delbrueckii subsp. lactis]